MNVFAIQFVDPALLMRIIKKEAGRRVAWLTAAKSMERKFIGWVSRNVGAVPVARAMDKKTSMPGKIYLPDPVNDPLTIRGYGTDFKHPNFQRGAQILLPTVRGGAASAEIWEVIGPEELKLKRPFDSGIALAQLTGKPIPGASSGTDADAEAEAQAEVESSEPFEGVPFKLAPKIDQGFIYKFVSERLGNAGCIGIFPEGGSHDRPNLLELKGMFQFHTHTHSSSCSAY
jgi:glycerol-3-phosphate O-acyltransferase/dihydroxyacetone phosphate acyltransferase